MEQRQVVITGIGCILRNCDTQALLWRQLSSGESQLAFEPHPARAGDKCAMGRVHDFDPARYLAALPQRFYASYSREVQAVLASIFAALGEARLDLDRLSPERVGMWAGSARPTFEYWHDLAVSEVADRYGRKELMTGLPCQAIGIAAAVMGVQGPVFTFSCTCSSGAVAAGHALRDIQNGAVDVALCVGHEFSLAPPLFAMYEAAKLLSREREDARRAVRPFVDSSGNAFGEGAITLVLEERAHAEARGADILAVLSDYGYGNMGMHPTGVDVNAKRASQILNGMLRNTALSASDIDFVVGHGNGVAVSDASEESYMRTVFGKRVKQVPLLSTKPIYGHLLGASSTLNLAAAALMLKHDFVMPTINVDAARARLSHQAEVGVAKPLRAGMALSYGMGGHNAALLLRKYERGA